MALATETHYINGQKVNLPRNYNQSTVTVDFSTDRTELNLSVGSFIWQRQEAKLLYAIYQSGITGTDGVDKGVPHRIDINYKGVTTTLLNGYIDLQNAYFDTKNWTVEANSIKRQSIDFVNERAQGVDFRTLYEQGKIKDSDFIFVPYVLKIDGYSEVALSFISVTFITLELQKLTSSELIPNTAESGTIIDTAGGVIRLVANIVYALLLFVSIIKLLTDIYSNLVQNIKYKASMRISRLFEVGALEMGMKFESNLLKSNGWKDCVIIPQTWYNPYQQGLNNKVRGFFNQNPIDQKGYYQGSYGQFLSDMISLFNGRLSFGNGKLYFEPKTGINPKPRFKIPKLDQHRFTTNAKEIPASITCSFITEATDNTLEDNYLGSLFQKSRVSNLNNDPDLNLKQGLKSITINFSRVKRKTNLTFIEELLSSLFDIAIFLIGQVVVIYNTIAKTINKAIKLIKKLNIAFKLISLVIKFKTPQLPILTSPPITNLISNRIDTIELPSDTLSTPRIAIINPTNNKLGVLNEVYLNARYIVNTFYNTEFEQKIIREYRNVPINPENFNIIFEDGYVYTPENKVAEVLSFEWDKNKMVGQIKCAENTLFLNNQKFIENEPQ